MYDWHDFATALRLFIMLANIFNAVDPKPDPTYGSKLLTLPDPTQRLSLVQRYSLDLKIFFVFEMIFWFFFIASISFLLGQHLASSIHFSTKIGWVRSTG